MSPRKNNDAAPEVPRWPTTNATVSADGSGELTINGVTTPIRERDGDAARQVVLEQVTAFADATLGRPVRLVTVDEHGAWELAVHPDGNVEELAGEAHRDGQGPPPVAPRPTPVPSPGPAPVVATKGPPRRRYQVAAAAALVVAVLAVAVIVLGGSNDDQASGQQNDARVQQLTRDLAASKRQASSTRASLNKTRSDLRKQGATLRDFRVAVAQRDRLLRAQYRKVDRLQKQLKPTKRKSKPRN